MTEPGDMTPSQITWDMANLGLAFHRDTGAYQAGIAVGVTRSLCELAPQLSEFHLRLTVDAAMVDIVDLCAMSYQFTTTVDGIDSQGRVVVCLHPSHESPTEPSNP